jgi:hypothetical protein
MICLPVGSRFAEDEDTYRVTCENLFLGGPWAVLIVHRPLLVVLVYCPLLCMKTEVFHHELVERQTPVFITTAV